ncbi:lactonase family protein [Sciscionella sediminilitoris]|uniref:lactonase family protein n=1 Tax=Sciscionella sediminilitoris TaxID=1445613 RepID=UPI00068FA698|nr:lactonase family protein [Sciscionella sp. SE31]
MGTPCYIGGFTSEGGPGLVVTEREGGTLTERARIPLENPSWLTRSGSVLYAVQESTAGAVRALSIADPYAPEVLGAQLTEGAEPTHCTVHRDWLVSSNYGSGSVAVHPIEAGGSLGALSDLVQHGEGAHAHQALGDPSGNWLLCVDIGVDTVFVYRIEDGKLREHSRAVLPKGSGPRHLDFHPDGERAYLVHEYESTVTVLGWDADAGTLTIGANVSTRQETGGDNFPGEIAVSEDGRFVYASNRGDNTIARLAVEGSGLRLLDTVPTTGDWPRQFALAESALYVGNERGGQVVRFDRDPASGELSGPRPVLEFPGVSMILP